MFLQMKAHPFFGFSISKTVLSLLLTAFLCITLCVGNAITRCADTDKQALLKLKNGFINGYNVLSSWNDKVDCCKWEEISCNNLTGHVTELHLNASELRGKIDSSLCELQHLTLLNLVNNNFEAQNIPRSIGSLSQLRELRLADSDLAGTIPRELGNLTNLQTLDLSGNNNLSASDLEWISHLSILRYLDMTFVNLSGVADWPSSITKISSLSELHFQACGLPYVNPKSFSPMNTSTSLKVLNLSANNLNSSIMPWVLNVSNVLTHLYLGDNSFQGLIPDAFGTMTSLEVIDFSFNHFEGGIPKSFRNLCQLKELYLHSNKLSGQVSDSIQQLCFAQSGIEILTLGDSPFSCGTFPNLTRFSFLQTLDLRNTSLCGLLPQSLEQYLPDLYYLILSHNNLSGPLPEFIDLPSLTTLDLSYNQLNGSLPSSMGQLSNLEILTLYSNNLNGQIINEAHLSNLSALYYLDVSHNQLSFNISSNWVPPFQLEHLHMSSCNLGPNFPVWLKNLWPALSIDISNAGISTSIPTWFWDLSPCLPYMNLSHNNIVGPFPKSFEKKKINCSALNFIWDSRQIRDSNFIWDLSFNNLSGPLPKFPTNLTFLVLSNNRLSGSLSSFCATPKLRLKYLDFSNNLLSGKLPDCLGHLPNLSILNLAKNNLSERIPKMLGTLQQILAIHLNDNNLSGEIPASLIYCHGLRFIDFGENNLQGELPSWIGYNLTNLIVLRLKANRFQGSIPTSLCHLLDLQILDLSLNNITGKIPHCLSDIIALSNVKSSKKTPLSYPIDGPVLNIHSSKKTPISYPIDGPVLNIDSSKKTPSSYPIDGPSHPKLGNFSFIGGVKTVVWKVEYLMDKAALVWKGKEMEYEKNLGLMKTIGLSCNHLEGEIPHNITKLMGLASLNLSRNNFTGSIPNCIGNMKMLESLDLSRNHLSGTIPASFSNLNFLSYLDLSFNNLSGQIPLATQLQTFNASSYIGNQGLCGPPLAEKCPTPPSPGSTRINDNEGEDKFISFGFYVTIALGFITGFWAICGTLVLKSSWRKAFFQFANNMWDWIYVRVVLFIAGMKRKFQD